MRFAVKTASSAAESTLPNQDAMKSQPTIYVVDDDPTLLGLLPEVQQATGLAVKRCSSAEELLDEFRQQSPTGCVLLELRLPGISGTELQKELLDRGQRIPLIFVTGSATVSTAVEAMKHGAHDFLEKPIADERLVSSVESALAADARRRAEELRQQQATERMERLSANEMEVLRRILAGMTNKKIASDLDISLRTVQFRRAAMMRKLEVQSKAELIALALACGVPPEAEAP